MKTGLVLEGGCSDSIPVEAFQKMGYGRNVVILTRPESYRKKEELRALPGLVYRRYPAFVQTLRSRHTAYNRQLATLKLLERSGSVFVIRPKASLNIGRLENNPEKVQSIYGLGRADALETLEQLNAWLKK